MNKIIIWGILSAFLLLSNNLIAQDRFANVTIKTHKITNTIYMLEGRGGNIGVTAGEDGLMIIDDQFAPLAEKISAALSDISKGKLEFVLNTHYHGDHTGGNEVFGKTAKIVAHTNNRKRLLANENFKKSGLPVVTFDDRLSIHFNGEEIKAIHFPNGHTDGDLIIFFTESNVVHMGDSFFVGRFPFIDLNSGGHALGLRRNIKKALTLIDDNTIIIPGHGPLSNKNDLQDYYDMLDQSIEHVRTQMNEGKSMEEIKNGGLPGKWNSWDRKGSFIEAIYKSIIK